MKYSSFILFLLLSLSSCTKYDVRRDNPKDPQNPNYVTPPPPPPPPAPRLICTRYGISSTETGINKLVAGSEDGVKIYVKNTGEVKSYGIECRDIRAVNSDYTVIYNDYSSFEDINELNAGDSAQFNANIELKKVPPTGLLPIVITLGDDEGRTWKDTLSLLIEKVSCRLYFYMPGPFKAYNCMFENYDVQVTNAGPDPLIWDKMTVTPLSNNQYIYDVSVRYPLNAVKPSSSGTFSISVLLNCGVPVGTVIPFKVSMADKFGNTYPMSNFSITVER